GWKGQERGRGRGEALSGLACDGTRSFSAFRKSYSIGQAPLIGKKKSPGTNPGLTNNPRRRPTLPRGLPRSTIGAEGLNCRVRNGNGCGPLAKVTGKTLLSYLFTWGWVRGRKAPASAKRGLQGPLPEESR